MEQVYWLSRDEPGSRHFAGSEFSQASQEVKGRGWGEEYQKRKKSVWGCLLQQITQGSGVRVSLHKSILPRLLTWYSMVLITFRNISSICSVIVNTIYQLFVQKAPECPHFRLAQTMNQIRAWSVTYPPGKRSGQRRIARWEMISAK